MIELPAFVRAAARLHSDSILTLPNVVGIGAAQKRVAGRATGEPAVVAYVSRKLPPDALRLDERVPPMLDVDGEAVRTDVIEAGESRFVDVDTATYRPVRGGCQILTAGGTGTAGAVMYDRRDQQIVLLTNRHVLTTDASPTFLPADLAVYQPMGGGVVGTSKRIAPIARASLGAIGYQYEQTVDAGIVSVNPSVAVQFDVVEIAGRHPFVVLPPFEGLEVVRRGFRTQLRTGTVEAVDVTVIVKARNGDRHRVGPSVFAIRSPERLISAMGGDSGSLVVDAAGGAARGLVFASSETSGGITWACDLRTVMNILELDTPCTGSLNALIHRATFRRLSDKWAAALQPAAAGGSSNALVGELIANMNRFRDRYLPGEPDGSPGATLGSALHRVGPDLAWAITHDEEAAGLLDRAFGEWLIQPTVFDLLEYRFPDDLRMHASAAFRRVRECCGHSDDLELLEGVFTQAAGRSMRELLKESPATVGVCK